jgi:protein-disulfide isomerase
MKKATTIMILVVGLVLGVALDRVIASSPPRAAAAPTAQAPVAAARSAPPAPVPTQKVDDPRAVYRVPLEDSPVRGPSDALVTIVEVSDFDCPFCKRAAPTMREIEKAYGGKVRFAFKHSPLSMHAHAVPAANISEEARVRGGNANFWAMHDALFEIAGLDAASMTKAAGELGIPEERVKEALTTNRYLDRIRRDQNLVYSLGARGTPTFFLNGRKVVGSQPFAAFKAVIDEELVKAEGLVKSGVAAKDIYARTIEKGSTAPVMMAAPASPAPAPRTDVVVAIRGDDPVHGEARAPVTIVEFADFQCPFCSRAGGTVRDVEQAFGKDVRIVWKHLPLGLHPNAMPAALAAEAAREQGKFWEMHDKLFANQQALSGSAFEQYAKDLKLDLKRFKATLQAPKTKERVEADLAAATAGGVAGTPTFVVNGEVVVGAEGLREVVGRKLTAARLAKR